MHKYSTFVTVIALAAFLSAAIQSAAPFVWCIAGDNDAIIEVGNGAGWHGENRHGPKNGSNTPSKNNPHDGCIDIALVGPVVAKAGQDSVLNPPTTDPPDWSLAEQATVREMPRASPLIRPALHQRFEPPHLAALRVTILLI